MRPPDVITPSAASDPNPKNMKNKNPIALLIGWISLAMSPVQPGHAADANIAGGAQSAGSISGRVQNVVTQKYLKQARISIQGTNNVTFTDEFGVYGLFNVPVGPVTLEIFYTDLDTQTIALTVIGGQNIEQNVDLTSAARYGTNLQAVMLDPYVIAANRETDAEALAVNEQRFAPNIKNVVASDAMGDLFASDAGQFLKYLPGLTVDYNEGETQGVSVRGLPSAMTGFTVDGGQAVNATSGAASRAPDMRTVALTNISRVEVTKVPTPSTPADNLAGSVNMISKRAFERSGAQLRYGLYMVGNSHNYTFHKTPHPYGDKNTNHIQPGFEFDYTLPIGKQFGIVLTGMQSNRFYAQNLATKTWNSAGTNTGASFSRPYFQNFIVNNAPRSTTRTQWSAKADWRITPNSVLSFGGQWVKSIAARTGSTSLTAGVGAIGTSTVAGGIPLSYGPDFTMGATGRGAVSLSATDQYGFFENSGANISYEFDNGKWRIESRFSYSGSLLDLGPPRDDHWGGLGTTFIPTPLRVAFMNIGNERPGIIQVFNNSNQEVDLFDYRNYRLTTARQDLRKNWAHSKSGSLDLRRRMDVFRFPTSLQVGGSHRVQDADSKFYSGTWNYTGTAPNIEPFLYQVFVNQDFGFGFRNIPAVSPKRAWEVWRANPSSFTQTAAQAVAMETTRRNNSEYAEEAVSAGYLQAEMRLLNNRLNVLTGVRFEQTVTQGGGLLFDANAVFVRNPDGSFAHNAQGARIRKAEAGLAGSMDELNLIRKERAYTAKRSYEGYYPSLHLTYNLRENLQARFAYARTYGRPDFPNIIPNATINEFDLSQDLRDDPNVVKGSITVRNTGLKPWTANNYDLSIEYYSDKGGVFGAGLFQKNIANFFGADVRVATLADLNAIGLDPQYVGWNLSTQFNSGDARVSGIEFNARQSLRTLGEWGQYFTVFANATYLRLEGTRQTSFGNFIPRTANGGVSFRWKRISIMTKLNYRGLNRQAAQPLFGSDGYNYFKERKILDLNITYQLTGRISVIGIVDNALNDNLTRMQYGSQTPEYARRQLNSDHGATISFGVKGTY